MPCTVYITAADKMPQATETRQISVQAKDNSRTRVYRYTRYGAKRSHLQLSLALLLILISVLQPLRAEVLRVAVAANFLPTMRLLADEYEAISGDRLIISTGSSGGLYAQIYQGAPYDLFFSADETRPLKLEQDGLILADSRFTYARGVLVLWSASKDLADSRGTPLKHPEHYFLTLANPRSAPYGRAAQQVMSHLGVWDIWQRQQRVIRAQSVGQSFNQVTSGAASFGFVALSQTMGLAANEGSVWIPPQEFYDPIIQQAVILKRTAYPESAERFTHWLQTREARQLIVKAGYRSDDDGPEMEMPLLAESEMSVRSDTASHQNGVVLHAE